MNPCLALDRARTDQLAVARGVILFKQRRNLRQRAQISALRAARVLLGRWSRRFAPGIRSGGGLVNRTNIFLLDSSEWGRFVAQIKAKNRAVGRKKSRA